MGTMPALTHPLTLEDRALSRNRWRQRRVAWGQSLFLGVVHAMLATLAVMLWLQLDPGTLVSAARWIDLHASALALSALVGAAWAMRRQLVADARRHARSSHAALPVWRDAQRQRDTRLRWLFACGLALASVAAMGLVALHDAASALTAADALRWSVLAALLAIVFVPAPRDRMTPEIAISARQATAPRWITALATHEWPHLPQWWWQRAGSTWMRGRAASALATGLLLAPSEAVAVVVPITLLLLGLLLNALDAAHRLAGDVARLLAMRPAPPRRLWRNLWPLHALLTAALALVVASLLHLLGAGLGIVMLVVAALMLGASIDLLLAVVLRDTPQRLGIARTQCLVLAAALASAFAPMVLPGALLLLAALARRVARDDGHA
jgi:hypothetical protein